MIFGIPRDETKGTDEMHRLRPSTDVKCLEEMPLRSLKLAGMILDCIPQFDQYSRYIVCIAFELMFCSSADFVINETQC